MFRHAAFAFALLVSASPSRAETSYYLVDTIATEASEPAIRAQAHELAEIYADLVLVSGVEAQLVWSDDPDINAFATEVDGERIVVVQEGLLARLQDDRDMVAAALGHELAHHHENHIEEGRRKREGVLLFGSILGAVVGAQVGENAGALAGAASGVAVGIGASLVALKFSRTQELEADRLSIEWMIDAGYDPDGMLRLQRELDAMREGHRSAAIFSTHPSGPKRYRAAERHLAKLDPPASLRGRGVEPLVDAEALAAAGAVDAIDEEVALDERASAAALADTPPGDAGTRPDVAPAPEGARR